MYSSSSQSSKSKKGSQPIKNNPVLDFKTKQTLNNNLCEQTFKNALRGDGEKVHNENRLAYVDPKIRKKENKHPIFSQGKSQSQTSTNQWWPLGIYHQM